MRWFASSRFTLVLFAVLAGVMLLVGGRAYGQAAPAEPTVIEVPSNIYYMVLENLELVGITLLGLSVVAVALIIQGFLRVRRPVLLPDDATAQMREMISQRQFRELIEYTEANPTFVSRSLNPALKRAPHFNAMKEAMETSVGEQTAEEFRKLEYLNILANVGPLLGLLGTVIGIMQAFLQMRIDGAAADPARLAGGISVALGTTMLGLMLAIPCLVAYGVLRTKVDRLTTEGALLAEDLLLMIKPAEARPGKPAAAAAAAGSAAAPKPAGTPKPAIAAAPPAPPSPPKVPAQG
jgi:biopolymer transport protein ExbB